MKLRPRLTVFSLLALAFCLSGLPALLADPAPRVTDAQVNAAIAAADAKPSTARDDRPWPDRRPIGQFDWVGGASDSNPCGWWMCDGLDARQPGYAEAFRKVAEKAWLTALDNAVEFGCQGVLEKDTPGRQPKGAAYRGHVLTDCPPEQTIDFLRWRVNEAAKRGLWVGYTYRHTHYVPELGRHAVLAPPERTLAVEMITLRQVLGATVRCLYDDTNLAGYPNWGAKGPGPLPSSVYVKAAEIAGHTTPETRWLIVAEFGGCTCPSDGKQFGLSDLTWGDPTYYATQSPALAPLRDALVPASLVDLALTKRGGFDVVLPRYDANWYDPAATDRLTREFAAGHVPLLSVGDRNAPFNAPVLAAWRASRGK